MGRLSSIIMLGLTFFIAASSYGQTRRDVFQPGEQLVYKVKYGPIKLGTVVIQTGQPTADGTLPAHMVLWSADNPFVHTKTEVTDQFDRRDLTLRRFEEHSQNGDQKYDKYMQYDPKAKTITYSDETVTNKVTPDANAYDDALGIFMNMRAWNDVAIGHKYLFHVRSKDGEKPVTLEFTNQTSNESVPALDDKEIRTRVINGMMDLGGSAPLGADGAFTAYLSDDAASVPVRIDMSIAVGHISLVLDKIKRNDWTANK